MKKFTLQIIAMLLLSLSATHVLSHELGSNLKPIALGADQTIIDFDKIVWSPLEVEGLAPGAEIAVIRGDLDKDGSEVIIKTPAGYKVAMHSHTSDETYIWIKGAYTLIGENGDTHKIKSGRGYISFPGNAPKHALSCDAKDYCLLYVKWSRPFNMIY